MRVILDTPSPAFQAPSPSRGEGNCHTVLDTVSHGFGVEELRSLEVEKKCSTPSPTLSWICSTLPEFRICGFATVCSICSLSGLVTRRPSANPLPLGEGVFRHCERSEFTPEAIQKNVKLVGTPTNQNTFPSCHTALDAVSQDKTSSPTTIPVTNFSTFQPFNFSTHLQALAIAAQACKDKLLNLFQHLTSFKLHAKLGRS